MKITFNFLLCLTIVFLQSNLLAEILLVQDDQIYNTNLKLDFFPTIKTEAELKEIKFIKLQFNKPKRGDNFYTFSTKKLEQLPAFVFLNKEIVPKIPKLEGCGHHPFEWLASSKIIGSIKSKNTIYIQAPTGAAIVDHYPIELPEQLAKILTKLQGAQPPINSKDIIEKLKQSVVFTLTDRTLVYIIDSDSLNQRLTILEKTSKSQWELRHLITITDDCP